MWACETTYVISTFSNTGYPVNYRDPKIYAAYPFVSACMTVLFLLLIPSLIGTVTGCYLTLRNINSKTRKSLLFYTLPIILFIIISLNITSENSNSVFGAFYWFAD